MALHNKVGRFISPHLRGHLSRQFSARPEATIPILDLAAPPAAQAAALHRACRDFGFFYLANTGISQQFAEHARSLAGEFFTGWPEPLKRNIIRDPAPGGEFGVGRGYQPVGDNVTAGAPDRHEALDMFRELEEGHRLRGTVGPMDGRNKLLGHSLVGQSATEPLRSFANDFDSFFGQRGEYVEAMQQLGRQVMGVMADSLLMTPNDAERVFGGTCQDSFWIMRLISYPPAILGQPGAEQGLGCGAHTDYGCLTLVNAPSMPGTVAETLQVRSKKDGEWIGVAPLELPEGSDASFVCNIGDMVELWTAGLYTATPHRVLPPVYRSEDEERAAARISVPFFLEPAFDDVVEPLPSQLLIRAAKQYGGDYGQSEWQSYLDARTDGQVEQYGTKSEFRDALQVPYGQFVTQKIMTNFD